MKTGSRLFTLAVVLGAFGLAGCNVIPPVQPDVTRFYMISSPATEPSTPLANSGLRIGLKAVEVSPYLRKGSMVVRAGDNEVEFPDGARWAEPLEQQIGGVLRQRLATAPAVGRVAVPPFAFEEVRDFDVRVRVLNSEGLRTGGRATVHFVAMVEISTTGADVHVVTRKSFVAPEAAWDGKDFARLAALLGEAVNALGGEIVAALPEKK
jgi:uncharacterized lipoprotein YmbA